MPCTLQRAFFDPPNDRRMSWDISQELPRGSKLTNAVPIGRDDPRCVIADLAPAEFDCGLSSEKAQLGDSNVGSMRPGDHDAAPRRTGRSGLSSGSRGSNGGSSRS